MNNISNEFTAKNILNLPRNWYSNHYKIELEILESFIDVNEDEIKDSISKFSNNIKVYHSNYGDEVEIFKKIDSYTFDLKEIIKEHFPDLKRKSNFLLIISDLERNLINFCNELKMEFHIEIDLNFKSNIFSNIEKFLKYNLKIEFKDQILKDWNKLKFAYKIRNKIIHNGNNKLKKSLLNEFNIDNDFIFSNETNIILLNIIKSFLYLLEKQLILK